MITQSSESVIHCNHDDILLDKISNGILIARSSHETASMNPEQDWHTARISTVHLFSEQSRTDMLIKCGNFADWNWWFWRRASVLSFTDILFSRIICRFKLVKSSRLFNGASYAE